MYKRALFVIAVAAACGDDDPARHLDSGVTIDSSVATIDAPWTPVTLTVKVNGVGQPNIVVHFQNADSSLVATEMTDATGTASHLMAPGGYVTAIDPYILPAALPVTKIFTFAGVKPGDHLQLSKRPTGTVSMTVSLPLQSDSAITRYTLKSSCYPYETSFNSSGSGSQPTGSVMFTTGCSTADILVTAFNSGSDIVGYFVVPGETVAANGTLNYTAKSYATPTSRTFTYTNTSTVSPIQVVDHIFSSRGEVALLTRDTTGNTATMTLPGFTGAVELTQSGAYSTLTNARHDLFDWGPVSSTEFTTDFGARKLPDVTDPLFDNATHILAWTEGTGASPDTDYIDVFVNRTATSNNFGIDWQMVAPHTGANAAFPVLPVGAVDYNADPDDIVDTVNLGLLKVPGGYDALRANGFNLETVVDLGMYGDLVTPTPGSAALVTWQEPLALHQPTTYRVGVLRHRTRR